jgi:hypothetical protein
VSEHRSVPEKVEDQDSGNLTLNHFAVDLRSTNHRFGLTSNPRGAGIPARGRHEGFLLPEKAQRIE